MAKNCDEKKSLDRNEWLLEQRNRERENTQTMGKDFGSIKVKNRPGSFEMPSQAFEIRWEVAHP